MEWNLEAAKKYFKDGEITDNMNIFYRKTIDYVGG